MRIESMKINTCLIRLNRSSNHRMTKSKFLPVNHVESQRARLNLLRLRATARSTGPSSPPGWSDWKKIWTQFFVCAFIVFQVMISASMWVPCVKLFFYWNPCTQNIISCNSVARGIPGLRRAAHGPIEALLEAFHAARNAVSLWRIYFSFKSLVEGLLFWLAGSFGSFV